LRSSRSSSNQEDNNPIGDSSYNDFKVDIPEFEGQIDPDLFLDSLQIVERGFEFKDILEGKKVKLVALKLRKYASIW